MIRRSAILLLLLSVCAPELFAQPQAKQKAEKDDLKSYGQALADMASGMLEIYSKLIKKGSEVWDGLAATQAGSVLEEVKHDAADQAKGNEVLLFEMKESIKNERTGHLDVSLKVALLQNSLAALAAKLDRFSVEVDKAAAPIGGEARVKFAVAAAGKSAELDAITESWKAGRFQEATQHLEKAQKYLDVMRKLVECLKDSVAAKKPKCDPDAFPMPGDEPKKAA